LAENTIDNPRLLVVSRESALLRPLCSVAESNCWHIESATSGWDAMERVQSGVAPDLLLLDLPRGDGDSLHILRWLRRLRPELRIIVICFPEDLHHKVEAMRLGAEDVLVRPIDESGFASAMQRHLASVENQVGEIASEDIEQLGPELFFISASPTTQKLRAQAQLLAEADVSVLILGEHGSGKDRVARLIHKLSVRSGFKFLKVNCGEMPEDLLEAELFGQRVSRPMRGYAPGKIERAQKGMIYLDEITEISSDLQGRLMHVLQEKIFPRPGTEEPVPADVRIIAATSANIERALSAKRLREDLYYRLSAFTVQVPPLRQRKSEIALLLRHSMHYLAKHYGLPPRDFTSELVQACEEYSWPGNLNELESFVKRYLVAGDRELSFEDLEASEFRSDEALAEDYASLHSGLRAGEHDEPGPTSLKSLVQIVKWEAERNAIGTGT